MRRSVLRLAPCLVTLALSGISQAADEIQWERIQLDARFVSEGVGVGDFNKDGKQDVVAGDYWYQAPDWKRHELRKPGSYWAGVGYSNSFCNWVWDINSDGWDDVILVGFPGEPFHWYENPKNRDGHWTAHEIGHSACNESPQFHDVNSDGRPEIVLGVAPEDLKDKGQQPTGIMGYYALPEASKATQRWTFTPISESGKSGENGTFRYYHGLGVADVNGDGRMDVVIPHGYWEAPEKYGQGPWTFHPHRLSEQPDGNPLPAADIYTEDLDMDGDRDIIMSCAHSYGVWWFENEGAGKFKYHLIDRAFSQTHAMHFVDVNGDGQKDLVTGKRFFAHNGADPGAYEPVVVAWYEIKRKQGSQPEFILHDIAAGRDTGIGTQFQTADINGDGLVDIALSNKKGVNILLQRRDIKTASR